MGLTSLCLFVAVKKKSWTKESRLIFTGEISSAKDFKGLVLEGLCQSMIEESFGDLTVNNSPSFGVITFCATLVPG